MKPFAAIARAFRALREPVIAAEPKAVSQPTQPAPAENISGALGRILRPQAAYRWMLPQLAAITPQYIEMVLRSALTGNHVQQWELFDLMLDTWPELAACAQELGEGVNCLKLTFDPFTEEGEEPSVSAVERCKLVSSALRRMQPDCTADENDLEGTITDIIDGWFRGVTCLEVDWQTVTSAMHGTILAPKSTFWVHPVCFGFDGDGRVGLRVDARGQISPSNLGGTATQGAANALIGAFPAHKFLLGIHKAKSGTALGGALLRPLAWWWCAANFSADWLLNLAELFGIPFRWATYDPTASAETVSNICTMLQRMGAKGSAAFPVGTNIEFLEAGRGSDHSPQGELLDRADRYARLLILGQTQSGGKGSSVGGQAFGKVESDVKQKRIEAAGRYACRVLNTQLIPSILTLNYGDADECPMVSLLADEEGSLEEAQRDAILAKIFPLSVSFNRKKYGQPEPQDEEDAAGGVPEPEEEPAKGAKAEKPVKAANANTLREIAAIEDDALFAKALAAMIEEPLRAANASTEDGHWVTIEHPPVFIKRGDKRPIAEIEAEWHGHAASAGHAGRGDKAAYARLGAAHAAEKADSAKMRHMVETEGKNFFHPDVQAALPESNRISSERASAESADFGSPKTHTMTLAEFKGQKWEKRGTHLYSENGHRISVGDMGGHLRAIEEEHHERTHAAHKEAQKGRAAIEGAIGGHDVSEAMQTQDFGPVSFVSVKKGTEAKGFHDGGGIQHLVAARNAEGKDGAAIARMMPEVIAFGKPGNVVGPTNGQRVNITHKGYTASLSLHHFGTRKTWLLTGMDYEKTT